MLAGSASPSGRRRWRRPRWIAAELAGVLLVLAGVVLVPALTAPGNDDLTARIAESARDHGLGFVVTGLENLQYRLSPPRVGGGLDANAAHALAAQAGSRSPIAVPLDLPTMIAPVVLPALPGEGSWQTRVTVAGRPALQVALLRPDPRHTSYLSAVAWMSSRSLRLVQHPGSTDPGGTRWSTPATIPSAARPGLVASFNSGFKISDSRGAFHQDGVTVGTFRAGAASLVVDDRGTASLGAWGRDVSMTPHVVSVRQNLDLLVDGGRLSPDIDGDAIGSWGATVKSAAFVWRSGLGITRTGDLVFAAGNALSARSLATLLQRAGAIRAMELDINATWVSFMWYSAAGGGADPVPHKLLDFSRPANRYYAVNNRDFFAVYAR